MKTKKLIENLYIFSKWVVYTIIYCYICWIIFEVSWHVILTLVDYLNYSIWIYDLEKNW